VALSAGDSLDTDLKVHGFSVVSNALSVAELHSLSTDFESMLDGSHPPHPPRFVSAAPHQIIAPKLGALVENISSPPRARVRGGIYQPAEQTAKVGWHTGSIAFFSFPKYLNVWIPLPSGSAPNATISVVDPSVLRREGPELAEIAEQNGSLRLVASEGKLVAYDNFHRRYVELPRLDLDKLGVRLTLNWGDALIMRHDVLHRPHDERGDELAVSFCVVGADTIMRRDHLLNMGASKFRQMAQLRARFLRQIAVFDIAQSDHLLLAEYDKLLAELIKREDDALQRLKVSQLDYDQFDDLVYDLTNDLRRRCSSERLG
jgi:hypothetical protein